MGEGLKNLPMGYPCHSLLIPVASAQLAAAVALDMDLTTPDNGADSTTGAATITTPTALTIDMPSATSTTAGPEALTAPPNLIFIPPSCSPVTPVITII